MGRYRPSTLRAAFAVSFIGLATSLGLAPLGVTAAALVGGGRQGWTDYQAAFFAADNRRILLAFVGLLLVSYLGAAISWLAWLSRVIDNVPALGGGRPRSSPRGAITAWFVPVVNLAKPYWILRDVHDRLAVPGRRNAPLWAWWICWLPTGINMTFIGAGLVFWLLNLGLIAIPLVLMPFYRIDPIIGLVATAGLIWALAGFFVRGRGVGSSLWPDWSWQEPSPSASCSCLPSNEHLRTAHPWQTSSRRSSRSVWSSRLSASARGSSRGCSRSRS